MILGYIEMVCTAALVHTVDPCRVTGAIVSLSSKALLNVY